MNLLNSFFRVKSYPGDTLLFEKSGYGEYSFQLPEYVIGKSIKILLSGGGGGIKCGASDGAFRDLTVAGNAEEVEFVIQNSNQETISGLLGACGLANTTSISQGNGGVGYTNGSSGASHQYSYGSSWFRAGGGGGSSSLIINNEFVLEASGGGGLNYAYSTKGGTGGGPNGGAGGQSAGNGKGAKGAYFQLNVSSFLGEDGYIKIYLMPN